MKNLFLAFALMLSVCFFSNAQENDHGAIHQGQWLIEINTGTWTTGNTGFSLLSVDGNTQWSVGAEGGYFVIDNLAVKVGLGYSDASYEFAESTFSYKVGVKYYLLDQIPLGLDFTGLSIEEYDPSWIGVQGGYAWFVSPQVSIEPTLRYNISLDDTQADNAFQGLIGFAFHF